MSVSLIDGECSSAFLTSVWGLYYELHTIITKEEGSVLSAAVMYVCTLNYMAEVL